MAPITSQNIINGKQNLRWLWFIHHGSRDVGCRGGDMNEETFYFHQEGTDHQDTIFSASCIQLPDCFLSYSTSKCWKLTPLRQPSLSVIKSHPKKDQPFVLSFSSLFMPFEKREESQCLSTAGYEPANLMYVFSLNSYNSPRRWALLPHFYKEILRLAQEYTNIR